MLSSKNTLQNSNNSNNNNVYNIFTLLADGQDHLIVPTLVRKQKSCFIHKKVGKQGSHSLYKHLNCYLLWLMLVESNLVQNLNQRYCLMPEQISPSLSVDVIDCFVPHSQSEDSFHRRQKIIGPRFESCFVHVSTTG